MKQELNHFMIGDSIGGNQEWFHSFMMRLGGCGAETACDSSIYFAKHFGISNIYPFDLEHLSKEDYVEFARLMEHYLWPRMSGIDRLDIYVDGYSKYLRDRGVNEITMSGYDGDVPWQQAAETLRSQIDKGYPVPTLILNHKKREFKDYNWHWFLINAYDIREDTMLIRTVNYSEYEWLDFPGLWETGYSRRGGFILYEVGNH